MSESQQHDHDFISPDTQPITQIEAYDLTVGLVNDEIDDEIHTHLAFIVNEEVLIRLHDNPEDIQILGKYIISLAHKMYATPNGEKWIQSA
jgi:hypothetical protein